jgi:arginyl-tRNA synthetase
MKQELLEHIQKAASKLGIDPSSVALDYPEDPEHGDFSTNVSLANAKALKMSPRALAEKILNEFKGAKSTKSIGPKNSTPDFIDSIEIAGAGFINFKIKDAAIAEAAIDMTADDNSSTGHFTKVKRQDSGHAADLSRDILIEYTDPNTFKVFHIGHLMANAVGESLSRLIESDGTKIVRLCYPSDIGLHIAKSIWAMQRHENEIPTDDASIQKKTDFLGRMYVEGVQAYEANQLINPGVTAKDDIDALNEIIYEKSSPAINALCEKGRRWSLEHFDLLYKRLGSKFDAFIFESDMAPIGLGIVRDFAGKSGRAIFEESEGAMVFKGEKYGLHTRVFINSHGLPTYEAKEMGLNTTKFKKYPDTTKSIVVTANEQNEYFKVVIKALSLIDPNVGAKTMHIGHGMLRFTSGKMSSRTGNVITAEVLIDDMKKLVAEKIASHDSSAKTFSSEEINEISDQVAIAAIKYTILRQAIGGDVIFDSAKSISFEGDSGPYLQYSAVRAGAVLEKAREVGVFKSAKHDSAESPAELAPLGHTSLRSNKLRPLGNSTSLALQLPDHVGLLEKLIIRFPDIVARARAEYSPQHVATYLINLAGAFNSFYGNETIVDSKDPLSPYRLALTSAFRETMTKGLWLLGIKVPEKM